MKRTRSEADRESQAGSTRSIGNDRGAERVHARSDPVASIHRVAGNQAVRRLSEGDRSGTLAVSRPDDPAEREAESVADSVMQIRLPSTTVKVSESISSARVQRLCARCRRRFERGKPLNCEECEQTLQRSERTAEAADLDAASPEVVRPTRTGGRPLPTRLRSFFEPRFGRNLGDVRVHTGTDADESAQRIGARAFTIGRDIAFRSGEYAPWTTSGKRLLAHELTHVVQQCSTRRGGGQIQRQTEDEPSERGSELSKPEPASGATKVPSTKRTDVALLLSPGAEEAAKALTISPDAKRLRVTSPEDLAAKLKRLSDPIGRLLVFSHSLASGDLGFETDSSTNYVRPETLAKALKGAVPPERGPTVIDFRGCSLGTSPSGMEQIRAAVHAQSAIGGNCFMISQVNGPVELPSNGDAVTPITRREQLTAANRPTFLEGLEMLRAAFGPARKCIIDDSVDAYFRAGGRLVAMWANPGFSTEWDQRKSKCYQDLTTKTVDPATAGEQDPGIAGNCELIRIEKPAENSQEEKKSETPESPSP